MKKIRVFDIKYDTDGQKIDLPAEIFFDVTEDFNADADLADMISDKTGFCVFACDCEFVD